MHRIILPTGRRLNVSRQHKSSFLEVELLKLASNSQNQRAQIQLRPSITLRMPGLQCNVQKFDNDVHVFMLKYSLNVGRYCIQRRAYVLWTKAATWVGPYRPDWLIPKKYWAPHSHFDKLSTDHKCGCMFGVKDFCHPVCRMRTAKSPPTVETFDCSVLATGSTMHQAPTSPQFTVALRDLQSRASWSEVLFLRVRLLCSLSCIQKNHFASYSFGWSAQLLQLNGRMPGSLVQRPFCNVSWIGLGLNRENPTNVAKQIMISSHLHGRWRI